MRVRKGIAGLVAFGSLGFGGSAFAENFRDTPPCPVFTKQVPMTHSWEDTTGQWSCNYLLTIMGNGLRDGKGNCMLKVVESKRSCVGAQPGAESV